MSRSFSMQLWSISTRPRWRAQLGRRDACPTLRPFWPTPQPRRAPLPFRAAMQMKTRILRPACVLLLCLLELHLRSAEVVESDLCVYGGTSAGVAAAVQATPMGKAAVLVESGRHLGGLSSRGLAATDIGNKAAIGGIAREF